MKSLLVDALRQAQNRERNRTLSDSGSFDTAEHELPPTANDPVAGSNSESAPDVAAGELELYETSASIDTRFGSDDTAAILIDETADALSAELESADHPEQAETDAVSAVVSLRTATGGSPALARYSPLICGVLAVSAAAVWFAAHHFNTGAINAQLASTRADKQTIDGQDVNTNSGAGRFPFITYGQTEGTEK